jgi:hypothetical protein
MLGASHVGQDTICPSDALELTIILVKPMYIYSFVQYNLRGHLNGIYFSWRILCQEPPSIAMLYNYGIVTAHVMSNNRKRQFNTDYRVSQITCDYFHSALVSLLFH